VVLKVNLLVRGFGDIAGFSGNKKYGAGRMKTTEIHLGNIAIGSILRIQIELPARAFRCRTPSMPCVTIGWRFYETLDGRHFSRFTRPAGGREAGQAFRR